MSRASRWRATFALRAAQNELLSWRRVADHFATKLAEETREVEVRERVRTQEEVTRAWKEASLLVEQSRRADRAASFFVGALVGITFASLLWVIVANLCM